MPGSAKGTVPNPSPKKLNDVVKGFSKAINPRGMNENTRSLMQKVERGGY
jgi:hypothetical protein